MKTIFPDEIPEEMEDLREGTDSIEDSLKPILETDEKLRKLSESTSSTLGKLTASSSMLSAFQGFCMNSIFRGFGELAISNAIPKYSFTNGLCFCGIVGVFLVNDPTQRRNYNRCD